MSILRKACVALSNLGVKGHPEWRFRVWGFYVKVSDLREILEIHSGLRNLDVAPFICLYSCFLDFTTERLGPAFVWSAAFVS